MARGEFDTAYFFCKDEVEYITLDMCTCGDMLSKTKCGECSLNMHALLELLSLMCMLKSPSIILFVAVGSRDMRWSVMSSMNILFVIVFFGG